ncbi:MAG: hypothetical protein AB7T06_02795 [Kofleriaceae bacterium]
MSEYETTIGDPFFGAGLGAGAGVLGGGLAGAAGGGLLGAGVGAIGGGVLGAGTGAVGGGLAGAVIGGAMGGVPGALVGGAIGAGVGALNGGVVGAGIGALDGGLVGAGVGGIGGAVLGGGAMGVLGSLFFNESDFREFPDELADEALGDTGLEVCSRGAFGIGETLGEMTNIEHWWLKEGAVEAGLGAQPLTSDPLDTTMVDQFEDSESDGVSCVPMEAMFPEHANVDVGCVEEMMTPGLYDFGEYGLGGICKDAVDIILDACDPDVNGPRPPLVQ